MGKPSSQTEALIQANYPYTAHIVGGNLSTATQHTTVAALTTGYTSTNIMTVLSSTISWPGLDGEYIDEAEFSLATNVYSTVSSSATSLATLWQWKNQSETTWTNLHTVHTGKSTNSSGTLTMSGYKLHRDGTVASGYNRLPINIRLRAYTKKGSKNAGNMRVNSASYIAIKTRKGNAQS